ncbi:LacI family DNA-binding transcriptional regulator [Bifidobacterium sp.]|uniref:LacI family DNA-binding transcriptional regulator n=1 Tax=Bifidobacterium TaxID=1678 RepID=UPI00236A0AD7|nr:LacI family DNA-binding transcriptional regulator [Bifidobacterium sp.]MDC7285869.1 LacI family transcriptional regulator [Bifidobacterium thermophilum]MDY5368036.1 LacI family DNA-binding transcriptional regulator [Bifidobacterium sp.]
MQSRRHGDTVAAPASRTTKEPITTATIQDVANRAKVSISTVSRSFTRPDLVSPKTRAKVLAVADELNFSISRSAAALKTGQSLRIALLVSDHISNWFSASVIEGLNAEFSAAGYDLSIIQIDSRQQRREFFDTLPVRRNADAVVIASFDIDEEEINRLSSVDVPIVGVNSVLQNSFSATVNIDDHQGSILAARHLIQLGHRRILYVRTNPAQSLHFSVQERIESFLGYCRSQGIEPTVVTAEEGTYRIDNLITQILSLPDMPTAIACQEDGIAIPLIFQLERNGFSVPSDISVIGYDDSIYAHDVGLTTIRQLPIDMARSAARKTLDLIEGHTPSKRNEVFPAHLVVRSSTARVEDR